MSGRGKEIKMGKLYGVGVGPGDPDLLTIKAVNVLRKVAAIFHVVGPNSKKSVSGGIVKSIAGCRAESVALLFSMARNVTDREKNWDDNAQVILARMRAGEDCALVTIGDPSIFSTFTYLMRVIRKYEPTAVIEIIPGITSFQAAAASAQIPLVENDQTLEIIPSVSGKEISQLKNASGGNVVVLKVNGDRDMLVSWLRENEPDSELVYASHVGLEKELITTRPEELAGKANEYLSLLIVKRGRKGK